MCVRSHVDITQDMLSYAARVATLTHGMGLLHDTPQPEPAHAQPACPESLLTEYAAQPSHGPALAQRTPAGVCWMPHRHASCPAHCFGLLPVFEGCHADCEPCLAGSGAA